MGNPGIAVGAGSCHYGRRLFCWPDFFARVLVVGFLIGREPVGVRMDMFLGDLFVQKIRDFPDERGVSVFPLQLYLLCTRNRISGKNVVMPGGCWYNILLPEM